MEARAMSAAYGGSFRDPDWNSELDVQSYLASIPRDASIAGMYFLAVIAGGKRRGVVFPRLRARYVPFNFYPMTEFAPLLVRAAQEFYPNCNLREGLRRLGHAGPKAFAGSLLGRVTLGSAEGVHEIVRALVKSYELNTPPCRGQILSATPNSVILSFENVHHFLDSHHVGVFEGALRFAHVKGRVQIASHSRSAADLLLEW